MYPKDGWQDWYAALEKPSWTPTGETIGLIWSILYPLIFLSVGILFYKIWKKKIPKKVATPFLINLAANFLFTPILFGLKNLPLASIDILVVLVTIVWSIKAVWKYSKIIGYLQIPYLIWVSIATVLQLSIFLNN